MLQDAHEELLNNELVDARGEHFRLLSLIGRGGMGTVYKAEQPSLGRIVAVKVLPVRLKDRSAAAQMLREGRAMGKLAHPNVISIYSVSTTRDTAEPFLVLEYFPSQTLEHLIEIEKQLAANRFFRIIDQILNGLSAAHECGIIHRDLKPSNILIDENDLVKIADFGIAKFLNPQQSENNLHSRTTRAGVLVGTPSYMSPEQCLGEPLDARSDIYSLGCVMFHALTGMPPFEGSAPMEIMYKQIFEQTIEFPDGCDPRFQAIISRALQKKPDRRFGSAAEMRECLQSAMNGGSLMPQSADDQKEQANRAGRRRLLMPSLICVSAVSLLGLLVMIALQWKHDHDTTKAQQSPPMILDGESRPLPPAGAVALAEELIKPEPKSTLDDTELDRKRRNAESLLTSAISQSRDDNNERLMLKAYTSLMEVQGELQEGASAIQSAEKVASLARKIQSKGSEDLVETLRKSATQLRARGKFAEALSIYKEAVEECAKEKDYHDLPPILQLAKVTGDEACALLALHDYKQAIAITRDMLARLDADGRYNSHAHELRMRLNRSLAEAIMIAEDPKQAIPLLQTALHEQNLSGRRAEMLETVLTMRPLMIAYGESGDMTDEQVCYQRLLAYSQSNQKFVQQGIPALLTAQHSLLLFRAHEESSACTLMDSALDDLHNRNLMSEGSYRTARRHLEAARPRPNCAITHQESAVHFRLIAGAVYIARSYGAWGLCGGDPDRWWNVE